MSAKLRLIWIVLALVILAGCMKTSSSGSASFGARNVTFTADVDGNVLATTDYATVSFRGLTVRVDKSRVLIDGKEVAKVPEAAKVVDVNYNGGTLGITADGAKVYETKIGK
jgi:hypothetical protein